MYSYESSEWSSEHCIAGVEVEPGEIIATEMYPYISIPPLVPYSFNGAISRIGILGRGVS
jgi:hypothetical protein